MNSLALVRLLAFVASLLVAATVTAAPSKGSQQSPPKLYSAEAKTAPAGVATNVTITPIWVLLPARNSPNWTIAVTNLIYDLSRNVLNRRQTATSPSQYVVVSNSRQLPWFNFMYAGIGLDKLWRDQANPANPFHEEVGQIPWCVYVLRGQGGKVTLAGIAARSSSPQDDGLNETQTITSSMGYDDTAVGIDNGVMFMSGVATRQADMVIIPFAPRLYNGGGSAAGRAEISDWILGSLNNSLRIDFDLSYTHDGVVLGQTTTSISTQAMMPLRPLITYTGGQQTPLQLQVLNRSSGYSYPILATSALMGTNASSSMWEIIGFAGPDGKFTVPNMVGATKFFGTEPL